MSFFKILFLVHNVKEGKGGILVIDFYMESGRRERTCERAG